MSNNAPIAPGSTRPVEVEETDATAGPFEERFEVTDFLGQGAMGEVLLARDQGLGREVAVKVLHFHRRRGSALARFGREAQVTAQLEHPNIVPVYSFEKSGQGDAAIVMRRLEGQTLEGHYEECVELASADDRSRMPSLEARIEPLLNVCDAMGHAHARGVVHRDLKPANIMVGAPGEVYVMDWGIAGVRGLSELDPGTETETDAQTSSDTNADTNADTGAGDSPVDTRANTQVDTKTPALTQDGAIFGTPLYMAPEQASGRTGEIGPASDQYAIGLMLFELAYLRPARPRSPTRPPLEIATEGTLEPAVPRHGGPVPKALRAIIERATAVAPADRYPDVAALALDLRLWQRGQAPGVMPDSPLQGLWRRLNRDRVFAMRLVLAVVLATAGSAVGSLWLLLDEQRTHSQRLVDRSALMATLGARARTVESDMANVQAMVESFGQAAEQLLVHAQPAGIPWVSPTDLLKPPHSSSLRRSPRHGTRVSPQHAIQLAAPGSDPAAVRTSAGKLAHVRSYMTRWAESNSVAMPMQGPSDKIGALWIYAGLENGLMVSFPGHANYPADYDPRKRPWYIDGARAKGRAWGQPYLSISGRLLLPCTRALRDPGGDLLGVVGMDVRLREVVERLRMQELPGWKASMLVTDQGEILARSTDDPKQPLGAGPLDPSEPLPRLKPRSLRQAIAARSAGGLFEEPTRLWSLQKLEALQFYLVVEMEL